MLAQLVFQYSQALLPMTMLLVGLALLTLYTYHRQSKPLSRYWKILLPGLRLLAMSVIAISILRPVITRSRFAKERGPIVIVLDNSQSMSVIDSSRPPAEWVGIAQALDTLPADTRDTEIDSLQSDCDRLSAQADEVSRASADLDYAKLSGRDIESVRTRLDQSISDLQSTAHSAFASASKLNRVTPLEKTLAYLERIPVGIDRQVWLDHIRDKARAAAADAEQARLQSDARLYRTNDDVSDACVALQSLSRIQLAQKLIQEPTNGLIARLGTDTPVQLFTISDRIAPIQNSGVFSIPADGTFTNLTGGIRAIVDSMQTAPPRAIVIFSDGRQIGSDPDAAALAGMPIYTVGVAVRAGVKDLSVVNFQIPAEANVNEKIPVTAEIRGWGMRGSFADITLSANINNETRHIAINDDRPIPLDFNLQFPTAGRFRVAMEISPVAGEISDINNKAERWINITNNIHPNHHPATRPLGEPELADLTGDEAWLRHLAESTNGQFFRLDQLDLLPKKLLDIPDDENRQIQIPLWDSPYLLCLVLGALTTEWALRKHLGLA